MLVYIPTSVSKESKEYILYNNKLRQNILGNFIVYFLSLDFESDNSITFLKNSYFKDFVDDISKSKEILQQIQFNFVQIIDYIYNGTSSEFKLNPLNRFKALHLISSKVFNLRQLYNPQDIFMEVRFLEDNNKNIIKDFYLKEPSYKNIDTFFSSKTNLLNSISEYNVYEVSSIQDVPLILYVFLSELIHNNIHIKRCECCQRFFIPDRPNKSYCDREFAIKKKKTIDGFKRTVLENTSCIEYGKTIKNTINRLSSPIENEYEKAKNRKRKNFYDNNYTQEEIASKMKIWKDGAEEVKIALINKEIKFELYKDLLTSLDPKIKLEKYKEEVGTNGNSKDGQGNS
ncbi:MAG TPA: hypothetical protein DCP90_05795 [Clostridiales bacterium]|nr:MAG: hypothetical protein A2Y22_04880 [Clostridiales bacterium GWD2_32_59]HAN10106.1 hypothetical protein [Clostridiales bacterium]